MTFRISNNEIITDIPTSHKSNNGLVVYNTRNEILRQEILLSSLQQDKPNGFSVYNTDLQYATLISTIDKLFYPSNNFGPVTVDISSGTVVAFGVQNYLNNTGRVDIYELDGSSWVPRGDPIYGFVENGMTGSSISLSFGGDIVAVSSETANNESGVATGRVDVYEWNGSLWVPRGDTFYGTIANEKTGTSVDISSQGNILAIGSRKSLNESGVETGRTDVYEWNGSSWVSRGDTLYGTTLNQLAGFSVSLSSQGDIISFSSYRNENESGVLTGSVDIYEWNGSMWVRRGDTIYSATPDTPIVVSLSSQGDILAVGAESANNESGVSTGRVDVYEWNGSLWDPRGSPIYGPDSTGNSVDISSKGDILAVCSRKANRADIYEWNGSSWISRKSYTTDLGVDTNTISLSSAGDVLGFSGYSGVPGNERNSNNAGGVKRIV